MVSCQHYKFWISIESIMLLIVIVFTAMHRLNDSKISRKPLFEVTSSVLISVLFCALVVTTVASFLSNRYNKSTKEKTLQRFYRDVDLDTESVCAICLEDKKIKSTVVAISCNHSYHTHCISQCLETQLTKACPMCRRELTPCTKTTKGTVTYCLPKLPSAQSATTKYSFTYCLPALPSTHLAKDLSKDSCVVTMV